MKRGSFREVSFRPVPLRPRRIPLQKVGKHPGQRSIRAEGVGGCKVMLTSAAIPHFEHLKFWIFFLLTYMCAKDNS